MEEWFCAGYRLREAELMFQEGQAATADRVMRGVVRKNPNYAGQLPYKAALSRS